ncbi:MAG: hypothetical protein P9L96_02530 [Candidatus Gygaella obscura]|nr:hypothetical protein [Candidatus Gygaella obscura]
MILYKRAQSFVDYVLIISIIGILFAGIQVYLQRGIQAHIKWQSDTLGVQEDWINYDNGSYNLSSENVIETENIQKTESATVSGAQKYGFKDEQEKEMESSQFNRSDTRLDW